MAVVRSYYVFLSRLGDIDNIARDKHSFCSFTSLFDLTALRLSVNYVGFCVFYIMILLMYHINYFSPLNLSQTFSIYLVLRSVINAELQGISFE